MQTTTKPFSLLASVYDDIMADIDYEAWAEFIVDIIKKRGFEGKRLLDLGCGTGNSSFPFFGMGYEVTGLDASEEMLEVARSKLPLVNFVQADFCSFELPQRFDVAVSLFDSLNNLLVADDFLATAKQVYKHLNPGGFFIFDVNTTVGLRDLWESGRAEGWVNDVYYRWDHSFDEATGLAKVEAFCSNNLNAFTEVHYERPYDPAEVRRLLTEAGFSDIETLSYPSGRAASDMAVRIWGVGKRP